MHIFEKFRILITDDLFSNQIIKQSGNVTEWKQIIENNEICVFEV